MPAREKKTRAEKHNEIYRLPSLTMIIKLVQLVMIDLAPEIRIP
jgi:hypothetical protein